MGPAAANRRFDLERAREAQYRQGCALCRQTEWQRPSGTPAFSRIAKHLNDAQNSLPLVKRVYITARTLSHRYYDLHQPAKKAHGSQQLLTPTQELVIISWLFHLALRGEPANKRTVRQFAAHLSGKRPGLNWIDGFLGRHPEVRLGKVANLDPKRAKAFNQSTVAFHFDYLKKVLEEHGIPWENVYNMDEKGCQRGGGKKAAQEKYFIPRSKMEQYRQSSDNLELVTIIECVCADGTSIKPTFVFSGTEYEAEWAEVDDKIAVGLSENGWTNNKIGLEWLKKCFVPQAQERNTSGQPILLILDGHGSHETLEMLEYAHDNNVLLYSLPPHTTHKLQPLDVGVFGPFSRRWVNRCNEYVEDYGTEIPRAEFVREYMSVRDEKFTSDVVKGAFKKSGICPLDSTAFTEDDFGPSLISSTVARAVPASYPTERPVLLLDEGDEGDDGNEGGEGEDGVAGPADSTVETTLADDTSIASRPAVRSSSAPPLGRTSSEHVPSQSTVSSSTGLANLPPSPIAPEKFYSNAVPVRPRRRRHASPSPRDLSRPVHHRHPLGPLRASQPHSRSSLVIRIPSDTARIAAMERELAETRKKLEYAQTHAQMAELHAQKLQRRVNAREAQVRKPRRKTKGSGACLLTAPEIRESRARDEEEKKKREEENAAREAAQKRKAREAGIRRHENQRLAVPFQGRLASLNKEELKDIAYALEISEDDTVDDLLTRIREDFTQKPEAWEAPRFCQLYDPSLPSYNTRKNELAAAHRREKRRLRDTRDTVGNEQPIDENARPAAVLAAPPEPAELSATSAMVAPPAPSLPTTSRTETAHTTVLSLSSSSMAPSALPSFLPPPSFPPAYFPQPSPASFTQPACYTPTPSAPLSTPNIHGGAYRSYYYQDTSTTNVAGPSRDVGPSSLQYTSPYTFNPYHPPYNSYHAS